MRPVAYIGAIAAAIAIGIAGSLGNGAALAIQPSSGAFTQDIASGASPSQAFTLRNTGTATLTFAASITGPDAADFSVANPCGAAIGAGSSCPVNVAFDPSVAGAKTASLTITDNAPGSPHVVALTGTATSSGGGGGAGSATLANLWVDTNGGTCTRQSSPAAYVDAAACASVSAAWTAASGGDTIIAKGGIYPGSFSASGAKSSTVTIQAAVGEDASFAGDGSLNGVTNMKVIDDRPVNLKTKAGIGSGLSMGYTGIGGASAGIEFDNVDVWCQNQAPYHIIVGQNGSGCTAPIQFTSVNGFVWNNGSQGPTADCGGNAGQYSCTGGRTNVDTMLCASNAACQNITFNGIYFHDANNFDPVSGAVHHEMWKIDDGQNLTFENSIFGPCVVAPQCDTASVFFGGTEPETADFLTFIGDIFDSTNNKAVRYGYNIPSGTARTMTFKFNTSRSSIDICGTDINNDNCGPGTGSTMSGANITWVGNFSYRAAFLGCVQGTYSKDVWFTNDSGTSVATCTGDNAGIKPIVPATAWVSDSTGDYTPGPSSPALNVGGATCSSFTPDVFGNVRPNGVCDAGAVER